MEQTETLQAIMVRAKLYPDEWTRLRKLALDRNETSAEIIGRLIRDFVDTHAPSEESFARETSDPRRARRG